MTVYIRLEHPIGNVIGRDLDIEQAFRVTGTVYGTIGVPEPNLPVSLDIEPIQPSGAFNPVHMDSGTNPVGNYWFDIPAGTINTPCRANIRVCASFFFDTECAELPIGVGMPAPPTPDPETKSWFDRLLKTLSDTFGDVGKYAVVGGVGLGVLWILTSDKEEKKK